MVTEAPLKIHNYVIGPFTQVSIPDWKHKTICERESLKGLVLAKKKTVYISQCHRSCIVELKEAVTLYRTSA
jgi:hypothetical protein